MNIHFYKYHGAGNDFIFLGPDFENKVTVELITKICSRTRGVGADGLIIALKSGEKDSDARMIYYNQDGSRGEMCGNGLRCTALYAHTRLGISRLMKVKTDSGVLSAECLDGGRVKIEIPVIEDFREMNVENKVIYFGSTGVPHAVIVQDDVTKTDVFNEGRILRYHAAFAPKGTNVDFISAINEKQNTFKIRTYERGVENETGACGTGISASAVALFKFKKAAPPVRFENLFGDRLEVDFTPSDRLNIVYLTGPAQEICEGEYKFN